MDARETGRQIIRELRGDAFLAAKDQKVNEFNAVIHDYADAVCFGQIWARDGIDRKMRSILNIAMLTALNRPTQLRSHLEGALNNGCTMEEIREILMQATIYCGLPAAFDAFAVAEDVLRARKMLA